MSSHDRKYCAHHIIFVCFVLSFMMFVLVLQEKKLLTMLNISICDFFFQ